MAAASTSLAQPVPTDPQALAEAVAAAMQARDAAARGLGIAIERVGPGQALVSMPVRADMLNGHGVCHGGFIFALADTAFAYACNAGNQVTVASGCSIDFLAPGRAASRLRAQAHGRAAGGRTGVYDIEVRDEAGTLVALFRGKSYRIAGQVIAGDSAAPAPSDRPGHPARPPQ